VFVPRFLYTGQRYFGGVGLYYYKARFYDPKLGRFLQPDPIGYGAGMNMYAYVEGDPVNLTDPSGLAPKKPPIICTGTRIPGACGEGGGIGAGRSGFSTAGPGGRVAGHFVRVNAGGSGTTVGNDHTVTASHVWVPDNWVSGLMPVPGDPLPKRNEPEPANPPDYCGSDEANLPEGAWPQACKKHDECYSSTDTKDKCDRDFVFNIVADCSGRIFVPAVCLVPAVFGGAIVTVFGGPAYKRGNPSRRGRPR
jgi:RHS repeat-associated protein